MTKRSAILAALAAALLSGVAFFNDQVAKNNYIVGNFLPVAVFGPLILFTLGINPLLRRLRAGLAFRPPELAAIMALTLFACYPAGRGFIHYFGTFLMLPHHHERTQPSWQGEPARLAEAAVPDGERLRAVLRAAAGRPPGDPARVAAGRLPAGTLDVPAADAAGRAALVRALNAVLADPAFRDAVRPETIAGRLPLHVRSQLARDPAGLTPERAFALHRGLFDAAVGEAVVPRRPGVLEAVPPRMLADPSRDPAVALDGFTTGLGEAGRPFPVRRIPWRAWLPTLGFWLPLLAAMGLCVIGLGLVLHRQWAEYERLPYPTVEFARAMLPTEGRALPDVFRNRLFWIGFGLVFAIHAINYANTWWPEYVIPVNRSVDLRPLLEVAPVFRRGGAHVIFQPTIFFTALGFAFFLSSDVALSLGVAPYVFVAAAGISAGYGVPFGSGHLRPTIDNSLYAGAAAALFATILYSGRRHLASVFARALGFRRGDPVTPAALWGGRAAMAGFALFVLQLAAAGVELPIAVLYTLGALMIFTVISRLLAEAGVFFFHPHFYACSLLWGGLGTFAIGPEQLLLVGMVSSLMLIDPREALMPFAMSGYKLAEDAGLRPGRIALAGAAAAALAALVAIPVSLYWQYREGGIKTGDVWTVNSVPRMVYDVNVAAVRELEAQGRLPAARALSGLARFRHASPQRAPAIAFAATFGLVLLFAFLRHRFARWPLHPLLFLMGGMYQSRQLGFSFLLGWLAKALVTKYGGARAYRQVKPLAIGLIAGEVLAALVPLAVGAVYHAVTGEPPRPFRILPG